MSEKYNVRFNNKNNNNTDNNKSNNNKIIIKIKNKNKIIKQ